MSLGAQLFGAAESAEALDQDLQTLRGDVGLLTERVDALEEEPSPVEPPPVEPPAEPPPDPAPPPVEVPTEGIPVPLDANEAWFLDYTNEPIFLFPQEFTSRIPLIDGATYQSIAPAVVFGADVRVTPTGQVVRSVVATGAGTKLMGAYHGSPFYNPGPGRVLGPTLRGFEIPDNQQNHAQWGAIDFHPKEQRVDNAKVIGFHVHHGTGAGIRVGHGAEVYGSLVEHMGGTSIAGSGMQISVKRNGMRSNGYFGGIGNESGAKFVKGDGVVALNYVQDEPGFGIWLDIDGEHDVLSNFVTDCGLSCVFDELSLGRMNTISDNVLRNAMLQPRREGAWNAMRAPLMLAAVQDVIVTGNDIEYGDESWAGVAIIQQVRQGPSGRYYNDNISVVENKIRRLGGSGQHVGVADDTGRYPADRLPAGWIRDYTKNWNNDDVPLLDADGNKQKASFVLEPNELVG